MKEFTITHSTQDREFMVPGAGTLGDRNPLMAGEGWNLISVGLYFRAVK